MCCTHCSCTVTDEITTSCRATKLILSFIVFRKTILERMHQDSTLSVNVFLVCIICTFQYVTRRPRVYKSQNNLFTSLNDGEWSCNILKILLNYQIKVFICNILAENPLFLVQNFERLNVLNLITGIQTVLNSDFYPPKLTG